MASIYDEAFNVIGKRKYNGLTCDFNGVSKKEFKINKQFTKELAFQMFLNDCLEDVLCGNFVCVAKEKVMNWAQKKYSYQVKEPEFEKLFAINHFAYGKKDAIEFAHKTIGEYFTAVKLYEDYFEEIDGTEENTWRSIFNAFRYKPIPKDIMQYLIDIILGRSDGNWIERFFNAYYTGIEHQTLTKIACLNTEYSTSSAALIDQIQIAFRNLTWLLTGLGFDNSRFVNTKENLEILASYFYGDINVSGWNNLDNINLLNSYLKNSSFKNSYLEGADLSEAHLEEAHLESADLRYAYLEGAELIGANFTDTVIIGIDFSKVDISKVDLSKAIRCL